MLQLQDPILSFSEWNLQEEDFSAMIGMAEVPPPPGAGRGLLMGNVNTPWIGLVALVAMFVLPFLPAWLFEGPRTVKHYPRRHICGDCGAPWTDGHVCAVDRTPPQRLRGQLRRVRPSTALVRRSARPSRIERY